ncbi:MAG: hypothetical protein ABI822_00090 [Bryobacteraceae bacterium]
MQNELSNSPLTGSTGTTAAAVGMLTRLMYPARLSAVPTGIKIAAVATPLALSHKAEAKVPPQFVVI